MNLWYYSFSDKASETKQKKGVVVKIKDEFERVGMYNQIMDIIFKISTRLKYDMDYPVRFQYDRNGKMISRVDSDDVSAGIAVWKYLIDVDEDHVESSPILDAFEMYVDSTLDMHLHNYSNALVRGSNPDMTLDEIRPWVAIHDSINHMLYNGYCGDRVPFRLDFKGGDEDS